MLRQKKKNITEIYLRYVNVKFTSKYIAETIENNPISDTFAGIREILLNFNIRSVGVVLSPQELIRIKDPFITLCSDLHEGFILVTEITDDELICLTEENKTLKLSKDDFLPVWDGKIIFPEVTEQSDEPNYIHNLIISISDRIKMPLIIALILSLIIMLFLKNYLNSSLLFSSVMIAFYIAGIIVSILLIMESLHIYNPLAHKICNSSPGTSCSTVLESKSAKLFGLIGWSEIGLIYFVGNLFFFILFPQSVNVLFIVSIVSLPYTIWSVAYQKFITKKWCPLCLTVQALLWLQFIVFIISLTDFKVSITISVLINYFICLVIPAILLWLIIPLISASNEKARYKRALCKIKSVEIAFNTVLAEEKICDLPALARAIVIGNNAAVNTITVISNPYCHYCAKFHVRLTRFLRTHTQFKAEIIFVGEDPVEEIIKFLISVYFTYDSNSAGLIYDKWFILHEKIIDDYETNRQNADIDYIYTITKNWYNGNGRPGTPSVFVNNHLMPDNYILEDLAFLF